MLLLIAVIAVLCVALYVLRLAISGYESKITELEKTKAILCENIENLEYKLDSMVENAACTAEELKENFEELLAARSDYNKAVCDAYSAECGPEYNTDFDVFEEYYKGYIQRLETNVFSTLKMYSTAKAK